MRARTAGQEEGKAKNESWREKAKVKRGTNDEGVAEVVRKRREREVVEREESRFGAGFRMQPLLRVSGQQATRGSRTGRGRKRQRRAI